MFAFSWSNFDHSTEIRVGQKKINEIRHNRIPFNHLLSSVFREPPPLFSSTAAMNSLVRNATSTLSRRINGFERLEDHRRRTFSTPRRLVLSPYTYRSRSDRAKKRQIFLRSYQLSAYVDKVKRSKTEKLKKMAVKVRAFVVSAVTFLRIGALRSCNGRSAISASSPVARTVKFSA